ncbi:MAG: hypothetical protein K0S65_5141 [Labilithrix sp.]|nr:hypothetical protein [Labilithrix sp.]
MSPPVVVAEVIAATETFQSAAVTSSIVAAESEDIEARRALGEQRLPRGRSAIVDAMEIRVWHSFSCNNSSSFRIVGKFRDASDAQAAATELTGFLAEATPLAAQLRRRQRVLTEATSFPFTESMDALASEHGFDWSGMIADGVYDDELEVLTEDSTIILYHPYCLGLGTDLPAYLRARGAEVEAARAGDPTISVLFRLPEEATKLTTDLAAFFAQADASEDTRSWKIHPPWSTVATTFARTTDIAFFCDGKTIGFYLPIDPSRIAMVKEWLTQSGVQNMRLRVCELPDLAKFRTIARARCEHCQTPLEYLDMVDHQIAADQLACSRCGGMFDLAAFP